MNFSLKSSTCLGICIGEAFLNPNFYKNKVSHERSQAIKYKKETCTSETMQNQSAQVVV